MLPLAVLPFPDIDPVIVQIGPLAIHWYGLGYVVGILFAWWYAKRLVANARLWPDGAPPMTAGRSRRFPRLGGDRHRARRPHRLHPVLRFRPLHRQSARHPRDLAGRHVLPWRLARRHHRHDPVRAPARHPASGRLFDVDRGRRARRPRARSASPTSSMPNSGAGRPTCPGPSSSRTAAPCRAIRASSTRPRSKACVLFLVLRMLTHGFLEAEDARLRRRHLRLRLRPVAHLRRVLPRAGRADRLSRRRLADHGHGAVAADGAGRHLGVWRRPTAPAARAPA